jgi:hypothetical protein
MLGRIRQDPERPQAKSQTLGSITRRPMKTTAPHNLYCRKQKHSQNSHTQKCRQITKAIYNDLIITLHSTKTKLLDNIVLNQRNSNVVKTPELGFINSEIFETTITLNKNSINSALSKLTGSETQNTHEKEIQ